MNQTALVPVIKGESGIVSAMGERGHCMLLLRPLVCVVRRSLRAGIRKRHTGAARRRTCVA